MINIFNRKELLLTYDMKKQSEVRTIFLVEYEIIKMLAFFAACGRRSASPNRQKSSKN